eukprot:scaffold301_cov243-Pinguiococcus_pyrenoidosus.AAC.59
MRQHRHGARAAEAHGHLRVIAQHLVAFLLDGSVDRPQNQHEHHRRHADAHRTDGVTQARNEQRTASTSASPSPVRVWWPKWARAGARARGKSPTRPSCPRPLLEIPSELQNSRHSHAVLSPLAISSDSACSLNKCASRNARENSETGAASRPGRPGSRRKRVASSRLRTTKARETRHATRDTRHESRDTKHETAGSQPIDDQPTTDQPTDTSVSIWSKADFWFLWLVGSVENNGFGT